MSEVLTRASASLGSFNSETRTVKAILATETPVRRRSWESGDYDEVLISSRDAIDSSRIDGLAVLDAHNQNGLDNRVGSVVPGSLRFLTGAAEVTIKLSRNEKGEAVFRDLEDGHLLGLSVGYRIEKTETTKAASGGVATIRATRWQPLELSFVSVPADPNAKTRSEEDPMSHPRRSYQSRPLTDAEQQQRAEEERQHHEIETRAMTAEEAGEFIRTLAGPDHEALAARIQPGMSRAAVRAQMCALLVERENQSPTFPHVETLGMNPGNTSLRAAMTDALLLRVDASHKPKDDAREFVGLTLPDLARQTLEHAGISTRGMASGEAVKRALHTTSDFSDVITSVGETVLGTAYASVPSGVKALARQTTAKDFKPKTTARLSGFSDLEEVNEHGEYSRGTFKEGAESYKIKTYGKVFGMTRQMIINDSLGAFANLTREFGLKVARKEADVLAKLVTGNPKMADNRAVFHSDHANLAASGAALSETSLSAARLAMGRQTGLAGELIDVVPAYLLVPLELQTVAEKLLATIQPTTTNDVNVFGGKFRLVVDRRLSASAWYLVADPALIDGIEYAYLEGSDGPTFDTRSGFDVDGVELKVSVDFGAGWIDHRGWYKNPGL